MEDSYLIISIEDDGKGFTANDEKVDDMLFTTNTGLGLYFAELSAEAHSIEDRKGVIKKLKSERLGGAKLAIYIPQ